ncbi:hypothetical protein MDA_GLEAN10009445 [Myotis davidii]|uniref:Uncharacterized protein n=1 Tax=Myotis davidii TaxID=225400 RepID=L5ME01_MYODS|nr:hypothetical protein MDA_GLEAN10009445 [Myotis davidii]
MSQAVCCVLTRFQFLSPAVTHGHICELTFSEALAVARTVRVCSPKSLATGPAGPGRQPAPWMRVDGAQAPRLAALFSGERG